MARRTTARHADTEQSCDRDVRSRCRRGYSVSVRNLNANQKLILDADELNWIRGDRSLEEPLGTLRARPQFEGLLGDIVHSAPQFVGGPRAIRRDQPPFPTTSLYSAFKGAQAVREPLVYVASNDGMMHGFNADHRDRADRISTEQADRWGRSDFKNELDQLASLGYAHRFFVDVTPSVEDVFMPPSQRVRSRKDWATILVGGLGGGGKGYYALNLSRPRQADYTSEVRCDQDTVLSKSTDQDDSYPVDSLGVPLGGAVGALVDLGGRGPIRKGLLATRIAPRRSS